MAQVSWATRKRGRQPGWCVFPPTRGVTDAAHGALFADQGSGSSRSLFDQQAEGAIAGLPAGELVAAEQACRPRHRAGQRTRTSFGLAATQLPRR